jgi:hypothetical protein
MKVKVLIIPFYASTGESMDFCLVIFRKIKNWVDENNSIQKSHSKILSCTSTPQVQSSKRMYIGGNFRSFEDPPSILAEDEIEDLPIKTVFQDFG